MLVRYRNNESNSLYLGFFLVWALSLSQYHVGCYKGAFIRIFRASLESTAIHSLVVLLSPLRLYVGYPMDNNMMTILKDVVEEVAVEVERETTVRAFFLIIMVKRVIWVCMLYTIFFNHNDETGHLSLYIIHKFRRPLFLPPLLLCYFC